ncbi:DUF4232 domain-containing protein [Phycicoccus sp. Soil748]|uniref:DUF4232 domain-containing protein n=1 Tax=Phycicoccus sp. Soil748 TaxID=1736397 RepID=UPI00138F67C2|nr:DUF4232 domain-containing protein [Phycicoccus sp. Soil748]
MGTTRHSARRQVSGLALVATTGLALAACAGSGGSGTPGTTTSSSGPSSTSTTSPSSSTSPSAGSSTSASSRSSGTSSGGTSSSTSGGATAAHRCTASTTTTRAVTQPGSGAAGSFVVELVTRNTGRSACDLQGYPGVSLTAPDTGAQIGAAATRDLGQSPSRVRLAPGASAMALVRVAQAANYGPRCHGARAAGFRVYLPGETAAQFAPFAVDACSNTATPLLSVRPFHR